MPRPRRAGAPEPKRRSRNGCWPCKARKVKCGEEKPACLNCQRQSEHCDYSVRLNWGGRTKRMSIDSPTSQFVRYGEAVVGLSDSFAINNLSPISFPTPKSHDSSDGFVNSRHGDLTSPGEISPSTPAPAGLFNSPRIGIGSEEASSPGPLEPGLRTTWAEQSPLLTSAAISGPLSQYSFERQDFDSPSYLGTMDQSADIRALSAFAFHSNPVSQPISYLRHSLNASDHHSGSTAFHSRDEGNLPRRSHDEHDMHFGAESRTGQRAPSGSPQDTSGLSSVIYNSHEVSIAQSNPISSPRLHETASNMGSLHDYHSEMTPDYQLCTESRLEADQTSHESSMAQSKWQTYLSNVTDNYGLDSGRPDQDLNFNNDHAAIDINSALDLISYPGRNQETPELRASQPLSEPQVQFCGGYYSSPVPINVPRYLSPLPSSLLQNPINLMYFHHFLDHTARMLVPHDCDNNAFISVLPSMAIGDSNLLNLLLAYSASHRARYLGHPEPANRIAHWVSQVFPTLRVALESSNENIGDSHLATALMLLSLKIVSPGTFEAPITWKSHLNLARNLFLARSESMAQPGNKIGAFFCRWLGYLDTIGSLSCREAGPPLTIYNSILMACSSPDGLDEFGVDCFTGFTPRTGVFLIRLAQLVQQCDNQRFDEMGSLRHNWHASTDMVLEAQSMLGDIDGVSERAHAIPQHHEGVESSDMMAIEKAFRCAGLLHLHRRVLGTSPDSFPVKELLRKLIDALGRMRPGAATEVCSLFPLFTAGCESRDPSQRAKVLDRFVVLESSGMKQIKKARQLMQHCWDRELPWFALAEGQFLG